MAEKKYLDLTGLSHYDEKIKGYIDAGDSTTLQAAKDYTDGKIGTLDTGISTVAAAIAGEKALREAADSALAANLGVASKAAVGTEGEEGYQAAVVATGLNKKVEDLEAAIGENGSVATQISNAIDALDKDDTAVANQFVTAVSETNGVITVRRAALVAADIPDLTLAKITDAGTAAAANVATVAIGADDEATDALVTSAQVKAYVDGLDSASDARLDALEATHATKTVGEGEAAHTEYLTVAEEAAAEVAKVVANAPEAYDTLKEIAEFIQKDGENGFDAAQRIQDLESAVAKNTLVVGDSKTATVQNAIDKAIADEVSRIDAVTGTPDADKTLQDEIDAVEAAIGTAKDGETAGTGLIGRVEAIEAELNGADTFASITENEIDALFAQPATT